MVWIDSNRKLRLPDNWNTVRRAILKRDGFRCQIGFSGCTLVANQVDHKIAGDNHQPDNLQAACGYCHAKKSSVEGHAAKKRRSDLKKRPPGKHPGQK